MASQAQINANLQNAQKSTGPRTEQGKAAVSQNAFKHGLFVNKAVIRDESQEEYDLHREAVLAEWNPVGTTETIVAERLVNLTWRLERAQRMQNQSIDYLGTEQLVGSRARDFEELSRKANGLTRDDPVPKDHLYLGRLAVNDWRYCKVLDKMMLYERRIENSMYRTINELKKLQKARKAEQAGEAQEQSGRESPPTRGHRSNPKKQSQFATANANVKSSSKSDYDDGQPGGAAENKANSRPIGADSQATGAIGSTVSDRREGRAAGNPLTGERLGA